MSYNGSGTFAINTSGQPVVAGTVISSTAFNALTADLATGLSTAITQDGQTTTTARIPFAAGINSSLTTESTSSSTGSIITSGGVGIAKALNVGSATDSSSISTGSIVTAGGVGVAKNLYVGVNANIAGTLDVTGAVTVTNPVINNIKMGYTTTATAGGTTTLTAASNHQQFFTGTLAQTIVLPVTSTLALGMGYSIENNSTGTLTVQSSGLNTIATIPAGVTTQFTCILITGTTAASWDYDHIGFAAITGTGSAVLATSPTITTPTISQLTSAAATALTLQSAGTTAITIDTSQNVTMANRTTNPTTISVGGATPSTSGSGITFPATQSASSDANTLDDYEEGTWTPSVGGTATYTARYGRYVKVGKMVTVQFLIGVNAIGTGSTGQLSGLPFASEGIGNVQTGAISYFSSLAVSRTWVGIYVENNNTTCLFISTSTATTAVENGTVVFGSGTNIYGSITYMT
jgi:hypothetical protein